MNTAADYLRHEIVRIASEEVGVREEGGNNKGSHIEEFQRATWLDPAPWAWCAAFCAWTLREALKTQAGLDYLARIGSTPDAFRCKDASAFGWIKWAEKHGLTTFDENSKTLKPMAGDFIVFDFSHIGLVTGALVGVNVPTIEGNTNGKGERDSEAGDGVWRKLRNQSLVKAYIRL